ncbi:MAG: hypothetical protein OK442_08470 [Thaumarchaeota archaeon]|nr:hypothetical protein [Nitrososphaerota archaeon]
MTGGNARGPDRAVSLELVIECADEEVATALNEALVPDNRYFPKDQRFRASKEGALLRFDVGSPRARPALSTVSSLISDAMLFRDVWVEAKTRGLGTKATT